MYKLRHKSKLTMKKPELCVKSVLTNEVVLVFLLLTSSRFDPFFWLIIDFEQVSAGWGCGNDLV